MRCKIFFMFLFAILFINLIFAGFQTSDTGKSIETEYGVSENLKAQINISFDNESLASLFNDSLGNSINLSDLLELNSDYNFTLNETFQTINSSFQILSLNYANFSMPSETGNFSYELNFTNETIFSEEINVTLAYTSVDEALEDKSEEIDDLKLEINGFDLFIRARLNEIFNISYFEEELEKIQEEYENATEEDYEGILENISEIKIPSALSEGLIADSVTFYPERNNVDLEIAKEIAGGNYDIDKEDEYIDALIAWDNGNIKTKITFTEISASYNDSEEIILRVFEFTFDRSNLQEDAYLIIESLDNLVFEDDYSEQESLGYAYINIKNAGSKVVFSTTEYIDFIDIPAFTSPSLSSLVLGDAGDYTDSEKESKLSKWMLFILIIVLLILIGIIVYVFLQIWYKRKYENYLFKNRNNLYNIMTYINNAKKKGMEKSEVVKNLRKAKWKSEQINYALRKYDGKRTGMAELPITKFLEKTGEKKPAKK